MDGYPAAESPLVMALENSPLESVKVHALKKITGYWHPTAQLGHTEPLAGSERCSNWLPSSLRNTERISCWFFHGPQRSLRISSATVFLTIFDDGGSGMAERRVKLPWSRTLL